MQCTSTFTSSSRILHPPFPEKYLYFIQEERRHYRTRKMNPRQRTRSQSASRKSRSPDYPYSSTAHLWTRKVSPSPPYQSESTGEIKSLYIPNSLSLSFCCGSSRGPALRRTVPMLADMLVLPAVLVALPMPDCDCALGLREPMGRGPVILRWGVCMGVGRGEGV